MATNAVVKNIFSSPFLLDKSKLTRLINIISDKYKAQGFQPIFSFEVTLHNGKIVSLISIEELFSLDNAVDNPISTLKIRASDSKDDLAESFTVLIRYDNDKNENILVQIGCNQPDVSLQLFSELEEQIERTFLKDWIYKLKKSDNLSRLLISILIIPIMIFTLYSSILGPLSSNVEAISTELLIEKYSGATTQEEKINFLFENTMRELKLYNSKNSLGEFSLNKIFSLQTLFIVLPILLVIGSLVYIFLKCYPHANFLWGDYEEYYAKILSRRSTLWNVVIISIIVGIIGSLFVMAISGYLEFG